MKQKRHDESKQIQPISRTAPACRLFALPHEFDGKLRHGPGVYPQELQKFMSKIVPVCGCVCVGAAVYLCSICLCINHAIICIAVGGGLTARAVNLWV